MGARDDAAIGVFDSGVGGLTVVRELRRELPTEHIVYLGDTARVPYGSKSAQTVLRYSLQNAQFLIRQGIKQLVIACNTASAAALPALEREVRVPVLGAVLPGAAEAARVSERGRIGVIGTLGTVRSLSYKKAIESLRPEVKVASEACPLFVPLAEEGWTEGSVPREVARHYLSELFRKLPELDTLVLGCTHYPLLRHVIEEVAFLLAGRKIRLVDPARAMARAARSALAERGALRVGGRGMLRCYFTDVSRIDEIGPRFLGEPLGHVEEVDL